MTGEPDLTEILATAPFVKRTRHAPEIAEARLAEQRDRNNEAQNMATRALKLLYPDAWASLKQQARTQIDAERGPLPGDKS